MEPDETDIRSLRGVGEQRARAMARLGIGTVRDLLRHYPKEYLDISQLNPPERARQGERTCLCGVVASVQVTRPRPRLSVIRAAVDCGGRRVECVWYNQPYLKNALRINSRWLFIGTLEARYGAPQVLNPLMERAGEEALPPILPVYRVGRGLSQKALRGLVRQALDTAAGTLPETLPAGFRERHGLAERNFACEQVHFPGSMDALRRARERLAFEEMFFYLAALRWVRERRTGERGFAMKADGETLRRFTDGLPYPLTAAQRRVLDEIAGDMARPAVMNRMVQGDVGSGKTVLAMAALYIAAAGGMQGALMAPTEILAGQHLRTARTILEPLGVRVGALTGGMTGKTRREALAALADGRWDVVIGTHALIQPGVAYRRLGLVVTDEQHRFGVAQRAALGEKGERPDMLVMSATPIPRTLALILYGDLDISLVDELPPGRRPVVTRLVSRERRSDMYRYVAREVMNGQQAYIVCPLVEDSDKLDGVSASGLYEGLLKTEFRGVPAGLIHGRMSAAGKEDTLARFRSGELRALVSTTVVEVGVDVPAATIMVVENADRFGLAQLHQLRGRVGRGRARSWCFLVPGEAGSDAMKRLSVMTAVRDGFAVAEKDLEMRGPGEFLGQRQAGLADPRALALLGDIRALKRVRDAVDALFAGDADPAEREAIAGEAMRIYRERLRGIVFN